MRSMVWRSAVAWLALCGSALAQTTCNPAGSPPSSVGCQPTLPGVMQSTDLLLAWRPSEGRAASRRMTPGQLLGASLPATFSSLSASGATSLSTMSTTGDIAVGGAATIVGVLTGNGAASIGPSDYRRIQVNPDGTEDGGPGSAHVFRVRRVGSDNTPGGALNVWVNRSSWVQTNTAAFAGSPGDPRFNTIVDTGQLVGTEPGSTWNLLSTLTVNASEYSQSAVGAYIQVVRAGLPTSGRSSIGVPMEGMVVEARDATNAGSASGGIVRTLELDMYVNGADTYSGTFGGIGREVMPIVLAKANAGGPSPTITSVIGVYPAIGDGVQITRGITWANQLAFNASLFDTRDAVQGTNAAPIWLKNGHKIAFDGTNTGYTGAPVSYLVHGSSALQYWSGGSQQASISDTGLVTGNNLSLGSATLTISSGSMGLSKITASAAAAGAGGGKIELVCGTNAGTAKLIAYAGTSATPVTILDNIGAGVTGC